MQQQKQQARLYTSDIRVVAITIFFYSQKIYIFWPMSEVLNGGAY